MEVSQGITLGASAPAAPRRTFSHGLVSMANGVLPLLDMLCLIVAAWLGTLALHWLPGTAAAAPGAASALTPAAWVAVVLAPFLLYDPHFGSLAGRGQVSALLRSHALRFTLFAAVALALGVLAQALHGFARGWLLSWFALGLSLSSLTRLLLARWVQRLQRRGLLREVIAVVGAGALAEQLVLALHQVRPETIELLGIFDDRPAAAGATRSNGTLAQLLELGKTRRIDWIVLTLPPAAPELHSTVQRLKALSVPIGLCPQDVGLAPPPRSTGIAADSAGASLLADRPIKRWNGVLRALEELMPRWITTIAVLPFVAMTAPRGRRAAAATEPVEPLKLEFDDCDLARFVERAEGFGQQTYGYVVTPNTDHVIRLQDDAAFRGHYAAASAILLDSQFLAHLIHFTSGVRLPVCTGSDLTAALFARVIAADDAVVLIGGSDRQAHRLRQRYGLRRLAHFNPPMGFIHDPEAVETCLRFIEAHSPFRFCLLAVGAPQQEAIAHQLKMRGVARGLALCVGASINFLTGDERRAPRWMQRSGIEWLYRLVQSPARLAKRYLVRGPRVFALLRNAQIVLRGAVSPSALPAGQQPPLLVEPVLTIEPALAEQDQHLVVVVAGPALPGAH